VNEDRPPGQAEQSPPPFPDSLCHACAAPPRYVRTERSVFIHCPILKRYPPQPVWSCEEFVPRAP
jgi:hypothetical protein